MLAVTHKCGLQMLYNLGVVCVRALYVGYYTLAFVMLQLHNPAVSSSLSPPLLVDDCLV